MLNAKLFLAVDFGAGSLKLAEFEQNEAGGLRLRQYGLRPLGIEGAQESSREASILKGLQELLAEKTFTSKFINVCAPGFHVFSKFVKLPPVDTSKVTQIIQYEAQQNVPFPLQEVVWDYQILGTSPTGELEVLLVAIKSDIVEGLFRVAEGAGLRLQLVDVSPAALCNAFRYNYGDLEGCTMLLDIGAKTSNLLFFEKGKVYSRSINIGANSITQDFATEAKLPFAEAERIKIEKGFVSLGGAYEEPEDPQAAAISKIARQVMTRLHIQVNQTIQFYRGQQGGSAPQRLFLSGGASIMPYTAQFFSEKLNVPVDYFNPFRNIQIDPALDLEELAKVAHSFGEVVGLGLRNLAHCPVELNLMPKSSIQRQEFSQKKPYFIAAVFSLVLVVFLIGWFYSRVAAIKTAALAQVQEKVSPFEERERQIKAAKAEFDRLKKEADILVALVDDRFYWGDVLTEIRRVLLLTEAKAKQRFNTDVGLWIDTFTPDTPGWSGLAPREDEESTEGGVGQMSEELRKRYGLDKKPVVLQPSEPSNKDDAPANSISIVRFLCRAVKMTRLSSNAQVDLAFDFQDELKASPMFVPASVAITTQPTDDAYSPTFTFGITVRLKKPFKM